VRKIPTIFVRDKFDRSRVTVECTAECLWVFAGEGIATRKWDGTAVMIQNGELWCRYDAKHGKMPPANFVAAQPDADPETGHWPGWVPAGTEPQYIWQRHAFAFYVGGLPDYTYEAVGPHFQGNPERLERDSLLRHGEAILEDAPRTFAELREWFKGKDIEGIVWHHPDGRMGKLKKKDLGLKRSD